MAIVKLDTKQITDWTSFHLLCKEVFGFPSFYGNEYECLDRLFELFDRR